jgi:hypothetical protein
MSSIGLTSALSNISNAAQVASTASTASVQRDSTATAGHASATLKDDTVKLSLAGQVKLMHRQGQSAALIAASLGTNVAAVDGYLGIKVAAQASTTPAASDTSTASSSASEPAAQTQTESPAATGSSSAAEPVATQAATAKS